MLEHGKFYRDATGAKRGPMHVSRWVVWVQGHGNLYDPEWDLNGKAGIGGIDLVAEWVDEAPRNEDPTPLCDLGNHVRGANDICIVCGATPEQVNEQARVAFSSEMERATRLATDYREKTGRGGMGEPIGAEALTSERKSTHGNWTDQAVTGVMLDEAVQDSTGYKNLAPYQRKAVDMILVKVSRIVSGDPGHEDHWDDIAGYAYLGKSGHKST